MKHYLFIFRTVTALFILVSSNYNVAWSQDCNIQRNEDYLDYVEQRDNGNYYLVMPVYHHIVKKVQGRYKYSYYNRVDEDWNVLDAHTLYWPVIDIDRTDTKVSDVLFFEPQTHDIIYETRAQCGNDVWTPWRRSTNYPAQCGSNYALESKNIGARQTIFTYQYGYEYYEAQLSADGGRSWPIAVQSARYINTITVQNLEMNTLYNHRHRVKCGGVWSYWAEYNDEGDEITSYFTDCVAPVLDEISTANVNMGTGIEVYCHTNTQKFQFRIREKGRSEWTTSPEKTQNHHIFPNLTKFIVYEIQCKVICNLTGNAAISTAWSLTKEHTIPGTCPQPVNEIGAKNIGTRTATLYCRSGHESGVTERHIFRYRKSSESNWVQKTSANNETNITNLSDNTPYTMQVQHECISNITGNWSNLESFTTEQNCNIPLDQIAIRNISYDHVDLVCQVDRAGYLWKYRKAGGGGLVELPVQTNSRVTITGLKQGTIYEVALKVFCDPAYSETYTEWVSFTTTACLAPQSYSLQAEELTNHTAIFTYSAYQEAAGYIWQYQKEGNINWQRVESNNDRTEINGLTPNNNYNFRLKFQCAENAESEWSNTQLFQTPCDAVIRRFSNITSTSITVLTNASAQADGYTFRYRMRGASNWTILAPVLLPEAVATSLSPNTEYEFQVAGECAGRSGLWSVSGFASTRLPGFQSSDTLDKLNTTSYRSTAVCDFPRQNELSATNITSSTAELGCSRGNVVGYEFRYGAKGDTSWTQSNETNKGVLPLIGLRARTFYGFQVRIRCSTELSIWSDTILFITSPDVNYLNNSCFRPALSQLIPSNIGSSSAVLNCLSITEKYQFRYREFSDKQWTVLPEQVNNKIAIESLKANVVFEFQCRLFCNTAFGSYSDSRLFKTQSVMGCDEPGGLEYFSYDIRNYEAKLICLNKAEAYQYRYRIITDPSWIFSDTIKEPILGLEQLSAGTRYLFQVRTFCDNKLVSDFSNVKIFNTLPLCAAPTKEILQADSIGLNSATIRCKNETSQGYSYRFRAINSADWIYISPSRNKEARLTNLASNTKYEYQVLVFCLGMESSSWSASAFFSTVLSTPQVNIPGFNFKIYPNPTVDNLEIEFSQIIGQVKYEIVDISGKTVLNGTMTSLINQISVVNLENGMYILRLNKDNTRSQTKFIVLQ